jgi:hypothetical protein
MRRHQTGITLMGMLIVMMVLGAFIYFGMRVFPMYNEYFAVKTALEAVAREPGSRNFKPHETIKKLDSRFITGYVNDIKAENIKIDPKMPNKVTIKWERRAPLFDKIHVLGDFEVTVIMTN